MMLDAKRTFDELIERLAPDERTRDEVLSNRIYQQLSGAVAGSQEFTAVAKLYELDRSGRFDVARPRHAAVAQRAGLPRRARPPDRLPRGPRAARVPRPDGPRREGRRPRHERRLLRPQAPDRRRPARRPQRLLPRARRPGRRLPRARRGRQGAAGRPRRRRSSSSPRPSASRSRRRSSSRGKLREARHAVRRPRRQPRAPARRRAARGRRRGARPPRSAATPSSRARSRAPTPRSARWRERDDAAIEHLRAETGEQDPIIVPQLDGDVHDVDGLVAIHAPPVRRLMARRGRDSSQSRSAFSGSRA